MIRKPKKDATKNGKTYRVFDRYEHGKSGELKFAGQDFIEKKIEDLPFSQEDLRENISHYTEQLKVAPPRKREQLERAIVRNQSRLDADMLYVCAQDGLVFLSGEEGLKNVDEEDILDGPFYGEEEAEKALLEVKKIFGN